MKHTGVFATKEETKKCFELAILTRMAQQRMYDEVNSLAKKYGLPDIKGNYGLEKCGEFVTTE